MNESYFLYMRHNQQLEDVIQEIVNQALNGNTAFSIDIEDDFSEDELSYIQEEVGRRMSANSNY